MGRSRILGFVLSASAGLGGCIRLGETENADVASVATKAAGVAELVGGADGFGGSRMTGYLDHAPPHMGFIDVGDLADPDATLTVTLHNESMEDATFVVTYFAHHLDFEDQTREVAVPAGQDVTLDIPCAEVVGLGPLTQPGGVGCTLAGGFEVENVLAVPVFLGMDFSCSGTRDFTLTPDVDDLDGDGDVAELILVSDGLLGHMQFGGPRGHSHGAGTMGAHMMGGMMFGVLDGE